MIKRSAGFIRGITLVIKRVVKIVLDVSSFYVNLECDFDLFIKTYFVCYMYFYHFYKINKFMGYKLFELN